MGWLGNLGQTQNSILKHVSFVKDDRQIKDVALGSEHTICLAADNTLWAWGWNEHANTGTGSGDAVFHPTLVPLELNQTSTITQIYAGGGHNFMVTEDCNLELGSEEIMETSQHDNQEE